MTAPPVSYLTFVLVTSVVGSVFPLAMMLQVLWQGARETENRLMAIFLFSVSLGSSAIILRQIANFVPSDQLANLLASLFLVGFMLSAPSLMGFVEAFAKKSNARKLTMRWAWLSILLAFCLPAFLAPFGLLFQNVTLVNFNHIAFDGHPILIVIALNILLQLGYLQVLTIRYYRDLPKSISWGIFSFTATYIAAIVIESFVESNLSTLSALIYAILFSRAIFIKQHLSPLIKLNDLLQESEKRYRGVVDMVFDLDFVIEHHPQNGYLFYWTKSDNRFVHEALPLHVREDLTDLTRHMTEESKIKFEHMAKRIIQGETGSIEIELKIKPGHSIWIDCFIYPVWSKTEKRVIRAYGVARDITAQKQAEHALMESEGRFRAIFSQTLQMIVLFDANGKLVQMNETAAAFIGPVFHQLMGKSIKLLARLFIDQSMKERAVYHIESALNGLQSRDEWLIKDQYGQIKTLDVSIKTIKDLEGNSIFIIWEANDITDQKKTAEAMIQAQKVESLGILAGGIAHDFNNLLTGILAQSSLVKMKLGDQHKANKNIEKVIFASEQAAALTRQMLAYAGKSAVLLERVDLNNIIRSNKELFRASINKSVTLNLDLQEDLAWIDGDKGQIQQIVMNLIINAAEAIGPNLGQINIRTTTEMLTRRQLKGFISDKPLDPSLYIQLTVEDNGCGLSPEITSRIFDPFFTTKKEGQGLGLAALLGAVHAHLGGVSVDSQQDKGTTFNIIFPAIIKNTPTSNLPIQEQEINFHIDQELTVLVADDEMTVRQAVQDVLDHVGWKTIFAQNGRDAVELYQEQQDEIDIVLLDIQMPIMNGITAYHQLIKINPNIKIILSSGYESGDSASNLAMTNKIPFLKKPYQTNLLLLEITELYRQGKKNGK